MWKNIIKTVIPLAKHNVLVPQESVLQQQIRTAFVLKRKHAPRLSKKGTPLKKLRPKHYIYELVEDTNVQKQSNMEVILSKFVEGVGNVGDKVSVRPHNAYNDLLLPGLAVYASPENEEKFKTVARTSEEKHFSSPKVVAMMESLSRLTLSIIMNKDSPWTLQPWHIRASFRKRSIVVPEYAITMPEKEIKGPDMNLEGKYFYITVTINKTEKVYVKCKVHHWSTDITQRLPYEEDFWKSPGELLFPEDAAKEEKSPEK